MKKLVFSLGGGWLLFKVFRAYLVRRADRDKHAWPLFVKVRGIRALYEVSEN